MRDDQIEAFRIAIYKTLLKEAENVSIPYELARSIMESLMESELKIEELTRKVEKLEYDIEYRD
jgi:hypothetical protein